MALLSVTELPLFRRELTELAQRRRTYVVRVVGAVILFCAVMSQIPSAVGFRQGMQGAALLGAGGVVFHPVVRLLFLAISVLMPALCCTSITSEKEQNTLGTLLLTRLSPGTIVLEKLFSRVVPMLTLLLLVSPVLAYVYSLGGVDTGLMFGSVWLLFCECVLFASLSLCFSSWFASSVSAFVWSYIVTALLLVAAWRLPVTAWGVWDHVLRTTLGTSVAPTTGYGPATIRIIGAGEVFGRFVYGSLVPLGIALSLLLLARIFLVRRAFLTPCSILLNVFRRLDQFFTWLNELTTGGIEIIQESRVLPCDDPVTWRERNKKSLGQLRWLVRVLLVLEGPAFFICAAVVITELRNAFVALHPLLALLWIFTAILTAVKGASLFGQERSRQTLEALLATPLTSRELLDQKIQGTNRLLAVLAVPLLTVNITQGILFAHRGWHVAVYVLLSAILMLLVFRTISWVTLAVGLCVQSQTRAIMAALCSVAGWIVLPGVCLCISVWALALAISGFSMNLSGILADYGVWTAWSTSAPGTIISLEEFLVGTDRTTTGSYLPEPLVGVGLGILWQAASLFLIRRFILRLAPRMLRRCDSPPDSWQAHGALHHAQS